VSQACETRQRLRSRWACLLGHVDRLVPFGDGSDFVELSQAPKVGL